ncbi:MAG: alpha/beta hydrolase [Verrucomicrobia bacterium]|nr:alpha/beta hydrolase [Verrucomicrobiota bacterium]
MKINRFLFPLLFLYLSANLSFAQNNANNSERLAEFLERFPASDSNKDGTLTRSEMQAFNKQRREKQEARQKATPQPTHANVAYGTHERHVFDIWLTPSDDPTPLVIYIHGGGFRGGNKNMNANSLKKFQSAGLSVAAIHYRLSDSGPYPIMMEDAARCLQTIRSRAREWNLDPGKVACYGGSAGAGISLWLAFHDDRMLPDSDDPIARQSTRLIAAATTNGQSTYDLRTYRKWFEVPDLKNHDALYPFYDIKDESDWDSKRVKRLMKDASAITHLTKDDVPVYMTYGRGDVPVDKDTAQGTWVHHVKLGLKLQEAMSKIGLECNVTSPDHPETKYGSLEAFLIAKLSD